MHLDHHRPRSGPWAARRAPPRPAPARHCAQIAAARRVFRLPDQTQLPGYQRQDLGSASPLSSSTLSAVSAVSAPVADGVDQLEDRGPGERVTTRFTSATLTDLRRPRRQSASSSLRSRVRSAPARSTICAAARGSIVTSASGCRHHQRSASCSRKAGTDEDPPADRRLQFVACDPLPARPRVVRGLIGGQDQQGAGANPREEGGEARLFRRAHLAGGAGSLPCRRPSTRSWPACRPPGRIRAAAMSAAYVRSPPAASRACHQLGDDIFDQHLLSSRQGKRCGPGTTFFWRDIFTTADPRLFLALLVWSRRYYTTVDGASPAPRGPSEARCALPSHKRFDIMAPVGLSYYPFRIA